MRRLTALMLVTITILGLGDPAFAKKRGFKTENGIGAEAGTDGSAPVRVRARRGSSAITCTYFEHLSYDGNVEGVIPRPVGDPTRPAVGGVYVRICRDAEGREVSRRVVMPRIRPDPGALAQEALSYAPLPKPAPVLSPEHSWVNFQTWLSVDGWGPVTATATVAGFSATVVATPQRAVWEMGDGSTVTCLGPGARYNPAVAFEAQRTDCGHTYRHSSAGLGPDNEFAAAVTVFYRATWTASDGTGGDLGEVSTTTRFPVRVGEIQAVNIQAPAP